ncbi:MAG: leucine-rich repeat protein [Bacteroidales bacterium]|nr:leucine-rich repeat protein [Bacteroidales bacterium]
MKLTNCNNSFRNIWMALLCGAMLCTACEKDDPKSTACDIVSFGTGDATWDINGTKITRVYPPETEAIPFTPTITLSPGATVNPPSGTAQDFFAAPGVTYTVTAEDGVTTKTYTVKATLRAIISGDCIWTLTGTPGNYTLTISGSGAMGSYENEDLPWYSYRDDIKTAVIEDGITSVGGGAFAGCSNLTAVTIPNSVTTIGYGAFSGCSGLISITIPNSVTNIGGRAFEACSGLTSVTIPNSVQTIHEWAFRNCTGLTSVTIGSSVQTIGGGAFEDCSGLTSVTIPNSVTTIGSGAFMDCSDLTSVIIPNSVTTIDDLAFSGCSGLTAITISNSVTIIEDFAFSGCSSLTAVTIPNSVQTIAYWAFGDCAGLTSVTIPNSVETIQDRAFVYCSSLTTVINHRTAPQDIVGSVFYDIHLNAATLKVPASAVDDYKAATGWDEFGKIEAISEEDE